MAAPSSDHSRWYSEAKPGPHSFALAEKAFEDGLKIFKQSLTKDPEKRRHIEELHASSIQDILNTVLAAKTHYQSKRAGSKTRECITAFSVRVCYYGNIMDVMVQHHPEYVSLVWGAMKLLFGSIVENENVGKTIVAALNDIADCLPRVELAALLYPTDIMQHAVVMLYAHIVRFLIRALEWYEESRFTHVLHSITRPASLRYDDLIKEIQRDTQSITDHALASSQAEQRDIHNEVRELRNLSIGRNLIEQDDVLSKLSNLTAMIAQLRESLEHDQAINASARIEFRYKLIDIQLTQALSLISSRCTIDHTSIFRTAIAVRDRHRFSSRLNGACFWTSPKLRQWNASSATSVILLKATFRQRLEIRDFCASVVEQLVSTQAVSLWILRDITREYSLLEIFKSLILQALRLDYKSHTDLQFSFQLQKFLDSHSDEDFVNVLGDILQHFKLVYIIADTSAMSADVAVRCRSYLQQLSDGLAKRNAPTVLKIIVSSYGSMREKIQQPAEVIVLNVGGLLDE